MLTKLQASLLHCWALKGGCVHAAGGYYMAMGCHAIVAEGLTITGSIGVVAATFNLKEVYRRIGFSKEVISRGR